MTVGPAMRGAAAVATLFGVGAIAGWALHAGPTKEEPSAAASAPIAPRPTRKRVPQPMPVEETPVVLEPPAPAAVGEIVGRAVLAPRRTPIAGAVVGLSARDSSRQLADTGRAATTDSDGVFRLAAVAPGDWWLVARLADHGARSALVTVRSGAGVDGVDFVFGDGGAIEGRVLTAAGPLAGASVFASRGTTSGGPRAASARTDGDGGFRFEDIVPGKTGEHVVCVDVDPGSPWTEHVTVVAGEMVRCDFAPPARLTGRVTLDGVPVPSGFVTVTLRDGRNWGGGIEEGAFALRNIGRGEGSVTVRVVADSTFTVTGPPVTLAAGDNPLEIRLGEGDRTAEIAGHLKTPAADGWEHVTVGFMRYENTPRGVVPATWAGTADVDASGDFRIRSIGAGRYHLTALRMVPPGISEDLHVSLDVDVAPGERKTGVIVLLSVK